LLLLDLIAILIGLRQPPPADEGDGRSDEVDDSPVTPATSATLDGANACMYAVLPGLLSSLPLSPRYVVTHPMRSRARSPLSCCSAVPTHPGLPAVHPSASINVSEDAPLLAARAGREHKSVSMQRPSPLDVFF